MKHLPLYTDHRAAVETEPSRGMDSSCQRCNLHDSARTVCIPPEGEVSDNTLLVVGSFPVTEDDAVGHSFTSQVNLAFRAELGKRWGGTVVFTYGVRCAPGGASVTEKHIKACRGYLANIVAAVKPTRIITLGAEAFWSVTGRKVPPMSVRRGYSHLSSGVPIFPLFSPTIAAQNTFRARHLMEDLEYALQTSPGLPPWGSVYHLVEDGADAKEAVDSLREHSSVTFDTEYSGPLHTKYFQVDTIAFAPTGMDTVWVWDEKSLENPECCAPLRALLNDPKVEKVGHNVKVDLTAVIEDKRIAATVRGDIGDTMIWRLLDDPDVMARLEYQAEMVGMGGHKLDMERAVNVACKMVEKTRAEYDVSHLDLPGVLPRPLEAAVHYRGLDAEAFAYGLVSSALRSQYCALDVVTTSRLAARMRARIEKEDFLVRAWAPLKPASLMISQVERWGFHVDRNQIRNVGKFVEVEKAKLLPKLAAYGVDFSLTKDANLREYLFEKLGLPKGKMTEGGKPSVSSSVLQKLQGQHPVVDLILQFNEYDTISTRYGMNLLDHVREDGRIHAYFNITGARTGRFSSASPNMQNIPSRSPVLAKMVKNAFVARPGYRLIQIDYSQLEYRVAAILSGDKVMRQVFVDGLDLHRRTAELISVDAWKIPHDVMAGYDKEQIKPYRAESKQVNFGLLYGLGASTLADDLGITVTQARLLVASIMGQFPDLAKWLDDQIDFCKRHGYVHTYFAGQTTRRRPLWGIAGQDDAVKSKCRNGAINTPVQGSAADYMLPSLNRVVDWLYSDGLPARVVGTVHDSMILEVEEPYVVEVTETTVEIMESWWSGPVPLVADVETGFKWGAMKEVPKDPSGKLIWSP